jgi:hypothetical protein
MADGFEAAAIPFWFELLKNMAFSAFGMAGWGILLVYFASHIFESTLLSK